LVDGQITSNHHLRWTWDLTAQVNDSTCLTPHLADTEMQRLKQHCPT
jgi:hypothetical protein